MSDSSSAPMSAGAVALATLCAMLWGGLAVVVRFTQDDLPPIGTAGLRFGMAALFLALWFRWQRHALVPRASDWGPIVGDAVLLYLQIGLFHWGLTKTNSAHTSLIIGAHPVLVALLAHWALPGDRLSGRRIIGLSLASAGLVAVVLGGQTSAAAAQASARDQVTLAGDAVILLSSVLLSIKTVFEKRVLAAVGPARLLCNGYVLATLGFLLTSWWLEPASAWTWTPAAAWGLAYQGLAVAGFCFAAWAFLLRRHRASQLAVYGFGQPLFGMLFGNWFRGDPLSAGVLAGGAAIVCGIWLVTRDYRPLPAAAAAAAPTTGSEASPG